MRTGNLSSCHSLLRGLLCNTFELESPFLENARAKEIRHHTTEQSGSGSCIRFISTGHSAPGFELQVPARPLLCPPGGFLSSSHWPCSHTLLCSEQQCQGRALGNAAAAHWVCFPRTVSSSKASLLQFCIPFCKTRHRDVIECPWSSRNGNQISKNEANYLIKENVDSSFFSLIFF